MCNLLPSVVKNWRGGLAMCLATTWLVLPVAEAMGQATNSPTGVFQFVSAKFQASEGEGNTGGQLLSVPGAFVTVIRAGGLQGRVMVDYATADGTATNGTHYTGNTNGTLVFDDFENMKSFVVPITDNTTTNTNKTDLNFSVTLSNPRIATNENQALTPPILGKITNATVSILDNDFSYNFQRVYYRAAESSGKVSINILYGPSGAKDNFSVDFSVSPSKALQPGSEAAQPDVDYVATNGTVNFNNGDTQQTIEIPLLINTNPTFNRDFMVVLQNPKASVTGTVTNKTFETNDTTGEITTNTTTEDVEIPLPVGRVATCYVTIINDVLVINGVGATTAGAADPEYNANDSKATVPPYNPIPGANNTVNALGLQKDGKVIIGGEFTSYNATSQNRLARVNPDGSLDPAFDVGNGADGSVNAIKVLSNGQVVVGGGFFSINGAPRYSIARLTATGDLDTTFSPGTAINDAVRAIATATNEASLYIAGDFTLVQGRNRNGIARLLNDGSLDGTFDPGLGANGPVYAVAVQRDGKVLIGGDFTAVGGVDRSMIARFNVNGSLDATFDPGGGADGPVYALAVRPPVTLSLTNNSLQLTNVAYTNVVNVGMPQGNITLNYMFMANTNVENINSIRIYYQGTAIAERSFLVSTTNNTAGTINVSYGPGTNNNFTIVINEGVSGDTITNNWFYFGSVTGFSPDVGKVLVGGAFTAIDLRSRNGLAQLNADGTLDANFDPGTGADGPVFALEMGSRSDVYAAGAFTRFNDVRRAGMVRLFADGQVDTSFMDPTFNQFAGLSTRTTLDPKPFINAMGMQTNGDLLIGGFFNLLGGNFSTNTLSDAINVGLVDAPYNFAASRSQRVPRNNFARIQGGSSPGPGNLEFTASQFSVDENGGKVAVTARRSNGSLGAVVLNATTLNGSALSGVNYTAVTNGAFRWSDGQTTMAQLPITILNDHKAPGDLSFNLMALSADSTFLVGGLPIPLAPAIGRRLTTVTILDGEIPPAFFNFASGTYAVDENAGNAVVTVNRSGSLSGRISVSYNTLILTGGSLALPGVNFLSRSGTLTFESGQSNKTFSVPILDNNIVEPDKAFGAAISNPQGNGARMGTNTSSTITIVDNDYAPGRLSFTATNFTALENGKNAVITVRRRGGNLGAVSVDYSTYDATAMAGINYLYSAGRLEWGSGESAEQSFSIPLIDDNLASGNKTLQIALDNFQGALPGPLTNALLTITDDDSFGKLQLAATNYVVGENEGQLTVIVKRAGGVAGDVFVNLTTTNGTAKSGTNYIGATNMLFLPAGLISTNVDIRILDEGFASSNKTFTIRLSAPVNATLGSASNAVVTIIDRESYNVPPGQFDTTFAASGGDNFVNALALQSDGGLLVGGDFTAFNGVTRNRMARLLPGGLLDTQFDMGEGLNGSVRSLTVLDDGRILVAGMFTSINGINRNYIARLNANASLDAQFNPGAGADNPVFAMLPLSDGRILVGGDFATFNGANRSRIARLLPAGAVDSAFDPGSGLNGTVYAMALQSDGKILVGGRFTTANNIPQNSLARFNPDGSVDTGFFVGSGPDAAVRALAVQSDGQILVGGLFASFNGVKAGRFLRLNPDGSIDESFKAGTGADNAVYAVTLQNDGKILLGGDFTQFNGITRNRITRLRSDGSIDPTINFGAGANSFVSALAIQSDRKIILGGGFTQFNSEPHAYIARIHGGSVEGAGRLEFNAARYTVSEKETNAVVKVIRSGGTAGTVTVDFSTIDGTAQAGLDFLGVTNTLTFAEGETVQTLTIPIIDDTLAEDEESVGLTLSNPAGGAVLGPQPTAALNIISDDTSVGFNSGSYTINENVGSGQVTISVVRTGGTNTSATVDFYTQNGSAIAGVDYRSTSGTLTFLPGETIKTFPVGIIDDTIVQGNHTVGLRLTNPTGAAQLGLSSATLTIVDNDFSPGTLRFSASSYLVNERGTNAIITVTRISGVSGTVSVDFATSNGTAKAGSKYVATNLRLAFADGEASKTVLVPIIDENLVEGDQSVNLRLSNPTGGAILGSPNTATLSIIDDDFGPGSLDNAFTIGTGANNTVRSITLQSDAKILIGGDFTSFANQNRGRIARLSTTGSVDLTFTASADAPVYGVAAQADGKVVIGGAFRNVNSSSRSWVARLTTDGLDDAAFNATAGLNGTVYSLLSLNDMRIVVGGIFDTPAGQLARLNDNGSLDITFNPDGGANGPIYAAAQQPDGMVVLGGLFTKMGGVTRYSIVRVNAQGLVDAGFATGAGVPGAVYAVAVQADGKIVIGGNFSSVDGVACYGLARLHRNGTVDRSFAANVYVSGPVYAIALQTDGKMFIGGNFSVVNDENRSCLARLNRDGTLDPVFATGSGANGPVYALAIQPDGKVLLGGGFTSVNGAARNRIARLLGDTEFKGVMGITEGSDRKAMQVYLAVQAGGVYSLQVSQDFTNWISLATNLASGTPMMFADSNLASFSPRFYRAQWLEPYLLSVDKRTNGNLVSFSVQAGQPYRLQASNNETDWGTLATNTSATTKLEYLDRGAVGLPVRYYRAIRLQTP